MHAERGAVLNALCRKGDPPHPLRKGPTRPSSIDTDAVKEHSQTRRWPDAERIT